MSLISRNQSDLHSESFLPLNALHTLKCMLEVKLACDPNLTDEERELVAFEIDTAAIRLKNN